MSDTHFSDIIKNRVAIMRNTIDKVSGNRNKLEALRNYHNGKSAIIVATGPGFQDYIGQIKESICDDVILICIKQSLNCFDDIADFHILNRDHLCAYEYGETKPITLMTYYPGRSKHKYGDIHFFCDNIDKTNKRVDQWKNINNNIDTINFNDEHLGIGENMVVNSGHIMMESVIPLCTHLGITNVYINGWIGGFAHGIEIKNEIKRNKKLENEQKYHFEVSSKLSDFFKEHHDMNIYTICESHYQIPHASLDEINQIKIE
jgi:hypothetical protein